MKFTNRPNEEVKLVDGRTAWLSRSPAVVASGYLDWDESGIEGIKREVFEETSFNIDNHDSDLIFDYDEQPFYVHTDPLTDALQNVSLSYIFWYEMDELPIYPEKFKNNEISEVKWLNVKDINTMGKWAFNHDERIEMAINKFQ